MAHLRCRRCRNQWRSNPSRLDCLVQGVELNEDEWVIWLVVLVTVVALLSLVALLLLRREDRRLRRRRSVYYRHR